MKIQVFWVVKPCSDAIGYCHFGATIFTLKVVVVWSSETLVSYHILTVSQPRRQ